MKARIVHASTSSDAMKNAVHRHAAALLAILSAPLFALGCGDAYQHAKQGADRYQKGEYAAAADQYQRAVNETKLGSSAEIQTRYNLGTARLANKNARQAAEALSYAARRADHPVSPHARYNLGNALYAMRRYADAVDAYAAYLKQRPDDRDAKHNLELALKQLEQPSSVGDQPNDRSPRPDMSETARDRPAPLRDGNLDRQEARRLLQMLGQDSPGQQARRLRSMVPPRRFVEKDW